MNKEEKFKSFQKNLIDKTNKFKEELDEIEYIILKVKPNCNKKIANDLTKFLKKNHLKILLEGRERIAEAIHIEKQIKNDINRVKKLEFLEKTILDKRYEFYYKLIKYITKKINKIYSYTDKLKKHEIKQEVFCIFMSGFINEINDDYQNIYSKYIKEINLNLKEEMIKLDSNFNDF